MTVEPPPAFSKEFEPDPIFLGDTSTLSFTIDNTDSVLAASGLDFTDNLPDGMVVADPPNDNSACTGGAVTAVPGADIVTYSGGAVDAGESCVIRVDIVVDADGTYTNTTGDLTSSSGNSGPASDTLIVDPVADLDIAKSDSPDPVEAGATLTYTLVVTNTGPSEATGIVVTDTLPNAFTPAGNTCGASGDPLVWNVGALSPDDHDACIITGTVDAGFNGSITNTATVVSNIFDPQSANNTVTETTIVYGLASIGDYVWYDANQDGIQDGGEDGVPDVNVNLRDGANITQLYTTTTGASGLYSFTDLLPGDYLLEFVLPPDFTFTLQDQGVDDAADSDADPATGQTMSTTLEAGENDFTWDAGIYEPASIGDYVWYDANRDGIQDDGEDGVPDVTVNLRDGANTTQLDTTTTGASGLYSFTDLLPGDYLIEFVLPPNFYFTLQDQGVDDAEDSDADLATGQTMSTTLEAGENDFTWDAGIYQEWNCYVPLTMRNYAGLVSRVQFDGGWNHHYQRHHPERN